MFKEKTKVGDKVEVGISQKSPEQLEAIANGDYDELKRRRKQFPDKWYPVRIVDSVIDAGWTPFAGHWLKAVYQNGDVLMGKASAFQPTWKWLTLDQDTVLFNGELPTDCHVYFPIDNPLIQFFTDSTKLSTSIDELYEEAQKHSDSASG